MSLEACAAMVERSDPDRFRVAMAAPPPARAVLFPLYAFNLEVARAPWATREPMLAEMRLQWWRDQVDACARGMLAPAHEVAGPLGLLLRDGKVDPQPLDALVEARRRDIDPEPLRSEELRPYLEGTAGNLLWASAKALGEPDASRGPTMAAGFAQGAAAWLLALPELRSRGRGLADPSPEAIRALAAEGLSELSVARRHRFGPGVPALRAASLAAPVLVPAAREPQAALDGRLAVPEGRKRLRLLALALLGRW